MNKFNNAKTQVRREAAEGINRKSIRCAIKALEEKRVRCGDSRSRRPLRGVVRPRSRSPSGDYE